MALWIQFKISKIFIKIPRVCSKLDFRTCHKIKLEFNQNEIGINTHTHTKENRFERSDSHWKQHTSVDEMHDPIIYNK